MAKTRKRQISLAEYRSNPTAEKKDVKGYKPYKPSSNPNKGKKSTLDIQLDKLSKIANTRLSALESNDMKASAYKVVEKKALEGSPYITIDKKGNPRFKRGYAKLSNEEKREAKRLLEKFLKYKTSTITGARKSYEKMHTIFEKNLGHNVSVTEMNTIGDMIRDVMKQAQKSSDETMDLFSLGLDIGMKVEDIEEYIKTYGGASYKDFDDIMDSFRMVKEVAEGNKKEEDWQSATDWDNIF